MSPRAGNTYNPTMHPSTSYRDGTGRVVVHYAGNGYIVGPDNPLIKIHRLAREKALGRFLRPSDMSVNLISRSGLVGTVHLVDVQSEDPDRFFFTFYGNRSCLEDRRDFQGRYVSEARWGALRRFATTEYLRAKRAGDIELTQVDVASSDVTTVYRRLIVPLRRDRCQVSHLLVAVVPDQLGIVPSTLDQERQGVLQAGDALGPAGRREFPVDH